MIFSELWEIVIERNKSLSTGKISMTTENFRKAMETLYNQGAIEQKKKSTSIKDSFGYGNGSYFEDIF